MMKRKNSGGSSRTSGNLAAPGFKHHEYKLTSGSTIGTALRCLFYLFGRFPVAHPRISVHQVDCTSCQNKGFVLWWLFHKMGKKSQNYLKQLMAAPSTSSGELQAAIQRFDGQQFGHLRLSSSIWIQALQVETHLWHNTMAPRSGGCSTRLVRNPVILLKQSDGGRNSSKMLVGLLCFACNIEIHALQVEAAGRNLLSDSTIGTALW